MWGNPTLSLTACAPLTHLCYAETDRRRYWVAAEERASAWLYDRLEYLRRTVYQVFADEGACGVLMWQKAHADVGWERVGVPDDVQREMNKGNYACVVYREEWD